MKKVGDLFHVVLCSHNGGEFIEEQINSILRQGAGAVSIHVHDFASSDATRAVLARLQEIAGHRLSITYHDDAPGAAASFVRALRLTTAALPDNCMIFLADQDDVWLPDKLGTIRAELSARRLSPQTPFILFHDVHVVDEALKTLRTTYYTGNPFRVPRDLDPVRLLMANPAIGHTMLISGPLVRQLVSWPETDRYMMHDWLAMLIASRIGRVEHIPIPLSLYRQHGRNVLGAYRTNGISVRRLLKFVDRMVTQTVAFTRAVHALDGAAEVRIKRTAGWDKFYRSGYRPAATALSYQALIRGPTWQRKMLAVLLLLRAVLGPRSKTGDWSRS